MADLPKISTRVTRTVYKTLRLDSPNVEEDNESSAIGNLRHYDDIRGSKSFSVRNSVKL